MLIAFLADIHSNIEALCAVLDKCRLEKVEGYVLLGDIVGYNASPSQCLEAVRNLNILAYVIGNHDMVIGQDTSSIGSFTSNAGTSCIWTGKQLSDEQKKWLLSGRMTSISHEFDFTAVHSSLLRPEKWSYISSETSVITNFACMTTALCFCGHLHSPFCFMKGNSLNRISRIREWEDVPDKNGMTEIALIKGCKYLINPGSIGQPRNGDPRASFCIYDSEKFIARRYCTGYDIGSAQKKIYDAGLPEELALRLREGN